MSVQTGPQAAQILLQNAKYASLASLQADGRPYASLVSLARTEAGWPLLLLSDLAWHAQNLRRDGRASLLVQEADPAGDILASARISIQGQMELTQGQAARMMFLTAHPEAEAYIDFGDFHFWQMEMEEIHMVSGFGRIETFKGLELLNK